MGVDETRDEWDIAPACVPGALWGVALSSSLAVENKRPPAFFPAAS